MGASGLVLASTSNFGLSYVLEWVGLVLVAAFFWRYLRPPLTKAMSAQAERIRASLEAGNEAKVEAERLVERERAALAAAGAEAAALLEQSRHGAERLLEEGRRRADDEYARVVARAATEIALERSRIEGEIGAELSELVLRYASRLVEAELDAESQHRLFGEVIEAAEAEAS